MRCDAHAPGRLLVLGLVLGLGPSRWMASAGAQLQGYEFQRANFVAATPGAADVNFESFVSGAVLNGVPLGVGGGSVTMFSPTSSLMVVNSSQTVTLPGDFLFAPSPQFNTLIATTGTRVLSPGGPVLGPGPNPAVEDDSVEFVFTPPVRGFGFDHLSQSADGTSNTFVRVLNSAGTVLMEAGVPITSLTGSGSAAWADFWGVISAQANIARVQVIETDADRARPDCNIGYDSLRVWAGGAAVCLGDFNGDTFVDDSDFVVFASCYEAFVDPCGDLTGDGFTDDSDFVLFAASYEAFACP